MRLGTGAGAGGRRGKETVAGAETAHTAAAAQELTTRSDQLEPDTNIATYKHIILYHRGGSP